MLVCARVCARSRGEWSQVISGVVTLGCLSPRPRLCAPVGVQACACVRVLSACARLRAPVCARFLYAGARVLVGAGMVWCGAGVGVVAVLGHTSFSLSLGAAVPLIPLFLFVSVSL